MITKKYYSFVPIHECSEPLVLIPQDHFAVVTPHPYIKLGAPYNGRCPYWLRQGVVERLVLAAKFLAVIRPGWRISLFDAYRPVAVQQFMVDYTMAEFARNRGFDVSSLTMEQREEIADEAYRYWAVPSDDPMTPPPHSTGAAVDVTLVDCANNPIPMGTEIDELTCLAQPDYFSNMENVEAECYHKNRQLLHVVMTSAGFRRNPNEWWHFSFGDQLWAYLMLQEGVAAVATYGRKD